jgi:hypothetical protein
VLTHNSQAEAKKVSVSQDCSGNGWFLHSTKVRLGEISGRVAQSGCQFQFSRRFIRALHIFAETPWTLAGARDFATNWTVDTVQEGRVCTARSPWLQPGFSWRRISISQVGSCSESVQAGSRRPLASRRRRAESACDLTCLRAQIQPSFLQSKLRLTQIAGPAPPSDQLIGMLVLGRGDLSVPAACSGSIRQAERACISRNRAFRALRNPDL